MVHGTWFNGLNADERKKNYEVVAIEYQKEKTFASVGRGGTTKQEAIRFHVLVDVEDDLEHSGLQKPPRTLLLLFLLSCHIELGGCPSIYV